MSVSLKNKSDYLDRITIETVKLNLVRYTAIQRIRKEKREALRNPAGQEEYLQRVFREELERAKLNLGLTELRYLARSLALDVLGFGPLYDPLREKRITEIQVYAPDVVKVEIDGDFQLTDSIRFRDSDHLLDILRGLVAVASARLDETSPIVDCKLPDGSRLNASISPVEVNGVFLGIRKFPEFITLHELVRRGCLTDGAAEMLKFFIDIGLTVIIVGDVGVGKTTFMNALADLIAPDKGISSAEEVAELQFHRRDIRRLEAKPPNIEGQGAIPLSELVRALVRHQHDWDIIGECRGAEGFYVLVAMTAGHSVMTTFHATSPQDAVSLRLPMLVGQSEEGRAYRDIIPSMIASNIDVVVQLAKINRLRRVVEIAAVVSESGRPVTLPFFQLNENAELVRVAGEAMHALKAKRPYRFWKKVAS
ncbi:CpaF family protein [Desulfotomaculum copahuensis]|uniref:Bacterial type II secretion system protein E domain-containing protein n=1 Tax=Desulfotomaculum copahuensis TaxID=1838280 RepID=A0A1B7LG31_9FIRM|nr:ATPase, T2SS/T4P/T4SS family [Desulfotomaculum copahuensis]OAT83695.1 hypothetical protein A6M21_07615 [Desulfotomaculum copahuensis]